jgi:hypothetical protein
MPSDLGTLSDLHLTADGNLYGLVGNGSSLFLRTANGAFTLLAVPAEARDGAHLALAPDGTIYATGFTGGNLWRYRGGKWDALDVPMKQPLGLACDATGRVYVADLGSGAVWRYDAGSVQAFPGFRSPGNVSIDPKGTIYVADGPVKILAEDGTVKDAPKDEFPIAFDAGGAYQLVNTTDFYSVPQGTTHADMRDSHGRLYRYGTLVVENRTAFVDGIVVEPAGTVLFTGKGKLYRFTPGSASATPPGTNP